MPSFEPVVLTEAPQEDGTSMAWRCTACTRVFLFDDQVGRPNQCEECEAYDFKDTSFDAFGER